MNGTSFFMTNTLYTRETIKTENSDVQDKVSEDCLHSFPFWESTYWILSQTYVLRSENGLLK